MDAKPRWVRHRIGFALLGLLAFSQGAQVARSLEWLALASVASSPGASGPTFIAFAGAQTDTSATRAGFAVHDGALLLSQCLEIVDQRDGMETLYGHFIAPGTGPSARGVYFKVNDIKALLSAAEVGFGASKVPTSPDHCGAAAVQVTKVDAITFRMNVQA